MKGLLQHLAGLFFSLGGVGLLLLGVLDSSFLFMPLGNDLLIVALTANHHNRWPYYVVMAAAGSVLGVAITDWVSRKGGEKGLEEQYKGRRLNYLKGKIEKYGGWALGLASLMPPPFPFTPFVIVSAALQYPRVKLLLIVGVCRVIRFSAEAMLALFYGKRIIQMAQEPWVQGVIIALVVVSIGGSIFSIVGWIRKSRRRSAQV